MFVHWRFTLLLKRVVAFLSLLTVCWTASASITREVALRIEDPVPNEQGHFGRAIAIDADYLVAGAPRRRDNGVQSGVAYLFDPVTGELLRTLRSPDPHMNDLFGSSVAIDGHHVLVGAFGQQAVENSIGQAYLYDARTGNLLHTFEDPSPTFEDKFGLTLDIEGQVIAIGSIGHDSHLQESGEVHLFSVDSGNLLKTILPPLPAYGGEFGTVDLADNRLVVGAPGGIASALYSGRVHVFDLDTGAALSAGFDPTPTFGDLFGIEVSLHGPHILVSDAFDDTLGNRTGQAHILDATTGALLHSLNNPNPDELDLFGDAVVLTDELAVVAASWDDTRGQDDGQVYLFDAMTGALLQTLYDDSATPGGKFGTSLAIHGDRLAVGKPYVHAAGVAEVLIYQVPEPSITMYLLLFATASMRSRIVSMTMHGD